jgi:hypothetical protein
LFGGFPWYSFLTGRAKLSFGALKQSRFTAFVLASPSWSHTEIQFERQSLFLSLSHQSIRPRLKRGWPDWAIAYFRLLLHIYLKLCCTQSYPELPFSQRF